MTEGDGQRRGRSAAGQKCGGWGSQPHGRRTRRGDAQEIQAPLGQGVGADRPVWVKVPFSVQDL